MSETFQRFVTKWVSTYHGPPVPATEQALRSIEREFGFVLPSAYVDFMLQVGAVYTPNILSCVVDQESALHSLQNIYSAEVAIDETRSWQKIGMAENLFAFASDCMGNKFCFDITECTSPRATEFPVYFFDHDFGTTDQAAATFMELLSSYVALEQKAG